MEQVTHDCGALISPDATICPSCGRPVFYSGFQVDSSPAATADGKQPPSEAAPAAAEKQAGASASSPSAAPRYCQTEGCGLELPPGSATCPFCGAPAPEPPVVSPMPGNEPSAGNVYAILPDGSEYDLVENKSVILGRKSPDTAISSALANCPGVSRNHATLEVRNQELKVTDMHSTNGTWLDGTECTPTRTIALAPRHVVRLGQSASIIIFSTPIKE